MPNFQNPAAFLLLILIPLLFILRKLKIFNRISFPAVLADWDGFKFEWHGKFQKFLSILAKVFLALGFILVVIAFADPVISYQEKVYTSIGTDIIFVVDTSPSMAAKDVNGAMRLEAAKNAIFSLSKEHDGYRYGLVGLGSNASVMVPPTGDSALFEQQLAGISVGSFGNGSAIGDGLSTAVCHLASSSAPKKCIILLTDGENNAGEIHPETAAKLAAENNITLYVIGVGSKGTVPIEYTDPVSGKQYSGYLDSDFNSASLRKIATIGNGRYFEVRTIDELNSTLQTVSKIENVSQNFNYRTVNKSYYKNFLLLALILFVIAWFIKRIILREMICYRYKKILLVRSAFLGFALIMVLLAYSGLSWGTYLVPVQKSGSAVSIVFDISNSMLAKDGPAGTTRLEAASVYAQKLLSKMEGIPVSVVLTKGDGIPAIPLTEDTAIINSLLEVLSPALSTVPGTSLSKGLLKAKETFPANYSSAGRIWLFTDCEETDGQLENAFLDCLKAGVPVTVIGFGSENETDVLAGDGKTTVKSALRSQKIQDTINSAKERFNFYSNRTELKFINSVEKGSAVQLLSQITSNKTDNIITSYEVKPVPRYKLFLVLAILAFVFSYIATEVDFLKLIKAPGTSATAVLCLLLVFTGCSSDTKNIFAGTYAYHKKQYRHSVSEFLKVAENAAESEDSQVLDYALYDLGTAYAMIGEDSAALERFMAVSADAPANVRYAAFYNAGVISHKNGNYEEAQDYFRKALEIDSTRIEAKINLELSLQTASQSAKQNETQSLPANEQDNNIPDIEKAVFEHIKENDKKQWKNSETTQSQNLASDY